MQLMEYVEGDLTSQSKAVYDARCSCVLTAIQVLPSLVDLQSQGPLVLYTLPSPESGCKVNILILHDRLCGCWGVAVKQGTRVLMRPTILTVYLPLEGKVLRCMSNP